MTLWKWSQTAASNDTADSNVNVRESWAPSIVNNSIRAAMAVIAKYRDDIGGNLVLGGTSTAYTVTTNQAITALDATTDGFTFSARMNATNGASATLAVDGLTAKQIRSVYGTNIPAGKLLVNGVYKFTYDSTDDAWIVNGYVGDTFATDNPDLAAIEAIAGTAGVARKTAANTWSLDDGTTNLVFIIDNNGTAITTGIKGDLQIPYACTILGNTALADQSGSIVVDVWKDTYANYPPTDADSITASAPITISSATKSTDSTLTGWTTSVTAGDVLRFNVDSITTITRVCIMIKVKRFI